MTVSVWGCGPTEEPAADEEATSAADEEELINGKIAGAGDFRPTLLIDNRCTAVKVGPRRILTAAHCVSGWEVTAGRKLTFHTDNAINDQNSVALAKYATVESLRVHPNYDPTRHMSDNPDVAVIVVKAGSPLDELPSALVSLDRVEVGTKLTITGYGCRQVMLGGGTGEHTLSSASATTVAATSAKIPYTADRLQRIDQNFLVTLGPAQKAGAAGVCPGDSGGPVYRSGTASLTVAALNSWTLGGSLDGPSTNMLARLHEGSRHSVGEWLSQQGVRLSRPCANTKRCTGAIKMP